MIYFCVKFQKDLLYEVNLTFFTPWFGWTNFAAVAMETKKGGHPGYN
jgi:hypothetical protein